MIGHVFGRVTEKYDNIVDVDVHGLGYEVQVTANDYDDALVDSEIKFYTYHHIREQSQDLYGFSTLEAKRLFIMLITVQGVGPKAALAILSLGNCEDVRNAIASKDSLYVSKASGVGKKTAERVVIDLSDKVGVASSLDYNLKKNSVSRDKDEAVEALMALGYNINDAIASLDDIPKELSTSDRVTQALKRKDV
jgi:Holliday junction DNA helicase RuvA